VTFDAGVHPHLTNLSDNPMQRWHESITDSSSSDSSNSHNSLVVNLVSIPNSHNEVTFSLLQARFALAKSTILIVVLPSIALDNSYFFNPTVKLDASIM
jgi:hypothetical protein